MPQVKGSKLYNQFVRGLITEATALSYPENASYDELNFELLRNGSRRRRRGIAKDTSIDTVSFTALGITAADIRDNQASIYKWEAASGKGTANFYVVQIADKLAIWDKESFLTVIDLSAFAIDTNMMPLYKCQFASGKGYLFIANPYMEPVYVKYDADLGSFTAAQIDFNIRDTFGVEDNLEVNERPESLSDEHLYNLLNQGWISTAVVCKDCVHPIPNFATKSLDAGYDTEVYPSNADVIYYGKIESAATATDIGKWDGSEVLKNYFGSTEAAKGHYILNAWELDRTSAVETSDLQRQDDTGQWRTPPDIEVQTAPARPTANAFYAGRVWWTGVECCQYAGVLFASQLIESEQNLHKYYQQNDPTAEGLSDPLDTDGVLIPIPEAASILKLVPLNNSLIVFASNGVWSISGLDGAFSATSYSKRKISSSGAISADSIVEVENTIFYWSTSGIFVLTPDNITGYLTPRNISMETIQTLYDNLPAPAKFRVQGVYDNTEKRVLWYYNDQSTRTATDSNYGEGLYTSWYTKVLSLTLGLEAFSTWEFAVPSEEFPVFVGGSIISLIVSRNQAVEDVTAEGEVVTASGEDVTTPNFAEVTAKQEQLLFTIDGSAERVGFSKYSNNTNFYDFYGWSNSAEAPAYLETGAEINEDALRDKQIAYLGVIFNRTEQTYNVVSGVATWNNPSGCTVKAKWDWSIADLGRWSSPWQAYKLHDNFLFSDDTDGTFDYTGDQSIVITKHRMRGRGYAVQLRFDADSGKDCQLLGWQIVGEGRSAV